MKQTSLLKSICALLQKGWGGSFCSSSSFFFFHVKYVVPSVERASLIAQLVKNPPAIQETPVQFLGGKIRWRRRYRLPTPVLSGFPHGSAGKESTCNAGCVDSISGLGRSPGEENGLPIPVFWPGEFHGLYSPWGCKQLDTTEQLSLSWKRKLLPTPVSLPGKSSWKEEPSRLQSMGLKKVWHNWTCTNSEGLWDFY